MLKILYCRKRKEHCQHCSQHSNRLTDSSTYYYKENLNLLLYRLRFTSLKRGPAFYQAITKSSLGEQDSSLQKLRIFTILEYYISPLQSRGILEELSPDCYPLSLRNPGERFKYQLRDRIEIPPLSSEQEKRRVEKLQTTHDTFKVIGFILRLSETLLWCPSTIITIIVLALLNIHCKQ